LALIEFLLKNWYIVIILLALVSQFRKVSSRGATPESRRKNSMPTFGGNPSVPQPTGGSKPNHRPEGSGFNPPQTAAKGARLDNGRTLIDTGASSLASKDMPYLEGKDRFASPFSNAADASNTEAASLIYQDAYADATTPASLQANKQQLAQGIIWAEILGPPRAKKPFRH
jgi:hypothetical protein